MSSLTEKVSIKAFAFGEKTNEKTQALLVEQAKKMIEEMEEKKANENKRD